MLILNEQILACPWYLFVAKNVINTTLHHTFDILIHPTVKSDIPPKVHRYQMEMNL